MSWNPIVTSNNANWSTIVIEPVEGFQSYVSFISTPNGFQGNNNAGNPAAYQMAHTISNWFTIATITGNWTTVST